MVFRIFGHIKILANFGYFSAVLDKIIAFQCTIHLMSRTVLTPIAFVCFSYNATARICSGQIFGLIFEQNSMWL